MSDKIKLLAVGGPTASGKSVLALALAEKFYGEIVSCDSMQIYKYMNIGTAKPTKEELSRVSHHLIDICDPRDNFSAADWASAAAAAIEDISSRDKLPIICGGTGMYLDALLRPTSFEGGVVDESEAKKIRSELLNIAKRYDVDTLHKMLEEIDPESAASIHKNNVKRVARAIEIFRLTGKTKTELDRLSQSGDTPYDCRIITLDYQNRDILYERIDRRVDVMEEAGLSNEVAELYRNGYLADGTTASQAIGYKELIPYAKGELSLNDCLELIKKNSRNYAKRQQTWFRRYKDISVVPDENGRLKSLDELISEVCEKITHPLNTADTD